MTARRWALALAGAAAIALLAARGGSRPGGSAIAPIEAHEPAAATIAPVSTAAPALADTPGAIRGGVRDPMWGQDPPEVTDVLEAYLITSVYPPQSRPLGRWNDDLLQPNQRHEEFQPVGDTALTYRFTADRYFVNGDEPLVSTLEVRRDGRAIEVDITAAFAAPYVAGQVPPEAARIPLAFARQGSVYVNQLTPAFVAETSIVGLYVEFDHGGREPVRAMFSVHATPASSVPARFTGDFRDYIEDGSLVVAAGIEVKLAGWYLIDCNLYDAEDNPVAWTRFKGELAAGTHMVPLSFFGKVLVDSQSTPPWHIGQLRGARYVEGRDPDLDVISMWDGEYETARYQLSDFSAATYDSAEKRARIERLQDARGRGVHGF